MICRAHRTAVVLLLLLSIAGCAGGTPTLVGVVGVSVPNERVPLTRLLEFTSSRPTVPQVTVSDGTHEWTVAVPAEARTEHALAVIGMRPATNHTVSITLGNDAAAATEVAINTAPLPRTGFPPIQVNIAESERMEPGMTLFNVIHWVPDGEDHENGLLVVVDEEGEVVWYFRAPHSITDARYTERGTFLYQHYEAIVEIDTLGNVIGEWRPAGQPSEDSAAAVTIDTGFVHHQAVELPSGELLVLGTEVRPFDDYPTSVTDAAAPRESTHVVGDEVLRFRRDGTITQRWRLLDALDPYRLSYDSLGGYWDRSGYGYIEGGTRDWSHANGVALDPRDGGLVLTVRHQDAAVKLSAEGDLVWILGDPSGWGEAFQPYLLQPAGELEWPYHPHGPQITADGNLMLFDNGNFRAVPPAQPLPDAENYSRAVEYAIDEEAMTVSQVWHYGGPGSELFYSPFLGDANRLPVTGNVLIADGGRLVDENGVSIKAVVAGRKFARLLEVTGDDSPQKVFELVIDAGPGVPGWSVFKADRIRSLR